MWFLAAVVALAVIPLLIIGFFSYIVEGTWSVGFLDPIVNALKDKMIFRALLIMGVIGAGLLLIDIVASHIRKN